MKLTLAALKFTLPALLAGAVFLATPAISLAQHRGGGGGNSGGSNGGGRSFQGGGGQQFSGQRNFSGGERNFGGRERGFEGRRDFDRGHEGYREGYRGGYAFGFSSAPFYGGYYNGYYGTCNPNGVYDRFGNWVPDPNCGYSRYAYGY